MTHLTPSEQARESGIRKVSAANAEWMDEGLQALQNLPLGWRGTGEDMRNAVIGLIGDPTHPNAWGALCRSAVSKKRGMFIRTGNMINMKQVSSHARLTFEYERTK